VNASLLAVLLACSRPVDPALGRDAVVTDASDGLCVSVQLDRWDADHRLAQGFSLSKELGVRVIRQDLRWAYVEPARDVWDWTTEDAVVDGADAFDLEVIGMLGYGNPWATSVAGADEFYPPDDPADFAAFAAAAAERYRGRVTRFELWNEPNSGFRFWKQDPPSLGGDPAAYAELALAAAKAIHAVAPEDEVMIGSAFFHAQGIPGAEEFMEGVFSARPELADEADSVSFHPYTLYPPRVPPEADTDGEIPVWEMIARMEAVSQGLPVVITEAGWPSFDPTTPQEQADWLVREAALAQAEGVRDVCWYTLEDKVEPSNPEEAFGLYSFGPDVRKPSGDAYAALAEAIAGTDAYGRVEDDLDGGAAYAVRYVGDGRSVTVSWGGDVGETPQIDIDGEDGR
jgi:hypothetical protein